MEQQIQNMITSLREQVEMKVPEEGTFEMVYETIDNTNPKWCLSHIRVAVRHLYSPTDEHERMRYVEVSVFYMPDNPYMCERLIYGGNKQEVLGYLADPSLAQKILDLLPRLESDLNSI